MPNVPESLLAELTDQPPMSTDEVVRITVAYSEVLVSTPLNALLVYSTSALPDDKVRIRTALFRMLDAFKTEDQKDFMRAGLKLLAYYQDGIEGSASLKAIAPDGRRFQEIVETEVTALTFELARRGHTRVSN